MGDGRHHWLRPQQRLHLPLMSYYPWWKLQIWHLGSLHWIGFLLRKSLGRFEAPCICLTSTWNLLTLARKVHNRALAEYSPLLSFSTAWTQAFESVNRQGLCLDWIRYGPKCFKATPMATPSCSQGIHFFWKAGSLALKYPAINDLLSLMTYKTAPMADGNIAASVMMWRRSSGLGNTTVSASCRADCAFLKSFTWLSDHCSLEEVYR